MSRGLVITGECRIRRALRESRLFAIDEMGDWSQVPWDGPHGWNRRKWAQIVHEEFMRRLAEMGVEVEGL